jgi:hypothetical protein
VFEGAAGWGRQFDVGLVGLQHAERLVLLDALAVALDPFEENYLADRFAHARYFDLY